MKRVFRVKVSDAGVFLLFCSFCSFASLSQWGSARPGAFPFILFELHEVMALSDTPLLKLESIGKEYYGNRVLSNVNFSLKAGEILGLVGENGAGKSFRI